MTTTAYILDGRESDDVAEGLAITAHAAVADPHHGVFTVHVTEAEFQRFLSVWRGYDRHSLFGEFVTEAEGLLYRNSDASDGDDDETFPRVGETAEGDALYAIDWWFVPASVTA